MIGDVVDVMEKVVMGEVDLVIVGKLEMLLGVVVFLMLENLVVVLIVLVLFCLVCNQVLVDKFDWLMVLFIMVDQGLVCCCIELWFCCYKISNLQIYVIVGGYEVMVLMVVLGCGVVLLLEVVLENSLELVCNWVMILECSDEKMLFEFGVCV